MIGSFLARAIDAARSRMQPSPVFRFATLLSLYNRY
jgi:hypothetical protein